MRLTPVFIWCRRRESNSQGHAARWILSPLRLPVSPLRQRIYFLVQAIYVRRQILSIRLLGRTWENDLVFVRALFIQNSKNFLAGNFTFSYDPRELPGHIDDG